MMRDKSIQLQPGREHYVDLSASVVSTNNIKDILPEARGCLFNDESDLDFYESYTYSNCRLECRIKAAEKKHNCIPWHLPKVSSFQFKAMKEYEIAKHIQGSKSTSCDPWTSRDFMEDMHNSSVQCHHCLSGTYDSFSDVGETSYWEGWWHQNWVRSRPTKEIACGHANS